MIEIKAENKGDKTELMMKICGPGEEVVNEAKHIMIQLPKRIKETNLSLFLHFLAEMAEADFENDGVIEMIDLSKNKEADNNAQPVEG